MHIVCDHTSLKKLCRTLLWTVGKQISYSHGDQGFQLISSSAGGIMPARSDQPLHLLYIFLQHRKLLLSLLHDWYMTSILLLRSEKIIMQCI